MSNLERIESIARKASSQLTNTDKGFIKSLSAELGIPFTPRPRCNDCYCDQALVLRKALKNTDAEDTREYILADGVDVIWLGQRINKDTLTDKIAEEIIAQGFAKYLFAKCK